MIVKFHARGVGGGSGPVDYLLGKNRDREGATLDRGNPDDIKALIDSSPYAKKYTSGVLSFEEADLDRATKDKLMTSFEKALLPGLDADQYACLWVEHKDKGRLELNFVVPNIELTSGKRLQPYFDRADRPRIDAWKTGMNASLSLLDPNDPMKKRELVTPRNLPPIKQEAARVITDSLLRLAELGTIKDRSDVVQSLEHAGFTVCRQTKSSISIADPDGGRNIRLKGMIYEQNFRFGPELRGEIEAASERYRNTSSDRTQDARNVYQRCFRHKRDDNQRRYKRPESSYTGLTVKNMALDGPQPDRHPDSLLRRDLATRRDDHPELADHQRAERHAPAARSQGWENSNEHLRRQETLVREDRSGCRHVWGHPEGRLSVEDTGGVLSDDRTRTAAFERIRRIADAARRATQRIRTGLQELNQHVLERIDRERQLAPASDSLKQTGQQLERASQQLERTAPAVGNAIRQEKRLVRDRSNDWGMSM